MYTQFNVHDEKVCQNFFGLNAVFRIFDYRQEARLAG
jgi:hypothetical protein